MTAAEKAALRAEFPKHWFVKVQRAGIECIVAIPKRDDDPMMKMPNGAPMPVAMLHGVTVKLGGVTA